MKVIEEITSSFHTEAWQNDSLSIVDLANTMMTMNVTVPNTPKRHVTFISQAVLTLVYITGVIGNVSALVILFHRDKRRNRKHLLMLRCLASNDLVALLGMLVQMYISIYVAGVTSSRAFCSLRVVWRLFGLFSGCVAIVMAAERWLALTRPFVYQKQVTYPVIVRCMLTLWLAALSLTSLPVLGFGLYYKDDHCVRYREATEPTDIAYAYVWFVFGTLLCLSIVWCNLAVSRALGRLGRRAGALRRISRASSRAKPLLTVTGPTPEVVATAEERAFARLMAVLSISFVVCWMPQMISIPLAQFSMTLTTKMVTLKRCIRAFHIVADILLCIHFTLDPYIYVLLRIPRPRFRLLKPLCKICWPARSRSNSFTGTGDNHCSSGDPPTPITEAPSTPVSEEHESELATVNV
ncbi:prostaglandin E2 receptor EP2 subtype-like isoform X1 [Vespa mandarinia]|uniref:prostaglandin E2 receptor EP2 subtype-like isoform X1 n=1 Tax=Vespa mandarinia TaxID=7446 RepID=UPI00160E7516|nr:prostaglandin E2 receptor EP2 subtype-like isoform X1 [Vespa mandarinia]